MTKHRVYYYECTKEFPGYDIGNEFVDCYECGSFYPEDYPEYFKKKYRYTAVRAQEDSSIIIEDISHALSKMTKPPTPFCDMLTKSKDNKA